MIELPELPFRDQDIYLVSARSSGDCTVLSVLPDGCYWDDRTEVAYFFNHEHAQDVAVALRTRIRPVRRFLGRSVECLAI